MPRPRNPEPSVRKTLALPQALWKAVDDYRYANRIASEVETVRRLLEAGLLAKDGDAP